MKFYQISIILNNKKIKPIQISNNKKIYNYLYNDYIYRNNKKDKMRHDKLYHDSELYPFSPLINKSGYITLHHILLDMIFLGKIIQIKNIQLFLKVTQYKEIY